MKHTPTPWRIFIKSPYSVHIESENAPESRLHIAKMDTYAGGKNPKFLEADAAFIVRAVNSHEELLEAAKRMRMTLQGLIDEKRLDGNSFGYVQECLRQVDRAQAIAKAEGAK